jgi:hypothetical protein
VYVDFILFIADVQGYPQAGLVSGICAWVAFFKYKDISSIALVPAGGEPMLAEVFVG